MKKAIRFNNFNRAEHGTIVTSIKSKWVIVSCRNPYGSHNLILCLVDETRLGLTAYMHGTKAVRAYIKDLGFMRSYRKLLIK